MGSPEESEEWFGIFSATQILIKPLPVLPGAGRVHILYIHRSDEPSSSWRRFPEPPG
jgi:hypothetical protein